MNTLLITSWASCLVFLCWPAQAAEKKPVVFESMVVPSENFSAKSLIDLAVRRAAGRAGFYSLWIHTSKRQEMEFWGCPSPFKFDFDYDRWANCLRDFAAKPWRMARYLNLDGSAVFQMRDEYGGVYRRVVSGEDFLQVQQDGLSSDIVEVNCMKLQNSTAPCVLKVFARSRSGVKADAAQAIWERFRGLDIQSADIHIQEVPWRLSDDVAGAVSPFETWPRVPSREEAESVRMLLCTGIPGRERVNCGGIAQ